MIFEVLPTHVVVSARKNHQLSAVFVQVLENGLDAVDRLDVLKAKMDRSPFGGVFLHRHFEFVGPWHGQLGKVHDL